MSLENRRDRQHNPLENVGKLKDQYGSIDKIPDKALRRIGYGRPNTEDKGYIAPLNLIKSQQEPKKDGLFSRLRKRREKKEASEIAAKIFGALLNPDKPEEDNSFRHEDSKKPHIREFNEKKRSSTIKLHPDFPDTKLIHDPTGASSEYLTTDGRSRLYIAGPYLLENFSLTEVVKNKKKSVDEISTIVKPLRETNERFYNAGALQVVSDVSLEVIPANLNADLGTQKSIRLLIEESTIDEHTFVILSHGHFAAGLAELSKAVTSDNKYLFDTTLYYPLVGTEGNRDVKTAIRGQLQLWGEEIKKAKDEHREQNREWAGGIAVAFDGHRNSKVFPSDLQATVDPQKLFGTTETYSTFLQQHKFTKVALLTEEASSNPDFVTQLPLKSLKDGMFGGENFDLYEYFKNIKEKGIEVNVFSADSRPPLFFY